MAPLRLIGAIIPQYPVPLEAVIRSVLIVDLNYMGDMLMASPVYRLIKERIPGVLLHVLSLKVSRPILAMNPYIDRIYDRPPLARYHLIANLNTSLKVNAAMALSGARYRLGYDYRGRGSFHNLRIPTDSRTSRVMNRTEECLLLFEKAFGWKAAQRGTFLDVPGDAHEAVNRLGLSGEFIGIHTACRQHFDRRRWAQEHFVALAQQLIKDGYNVVFTGAKDDVDYVGDIAFRSGGRSLAGLNLAQTAAVISRARLFITINTLPMHMAVALNVPTVAIIGGSPARVVYPLDNPRFRYIEDPALRDYDPDDPWVRNPRLNEITPEDVYRESLRVLEMR